MARDEQPPAEDRPRRRSRRGASRHEQAVIQAEVRRLARALRSYRVMRRDVLERSVRGANWNDGGFERALDAAVQMGAIKRLPLDFYGSADSDRHQHPPGGGDAPEMDEGC